MEDQERSQPKLKKIKANQKKISEIQYGYEEDSEIEVDLI
jgi:hypothetical protein